MHLVALLEQQLREVAAVLARDPGDERLLRCHVTSSTLRADKPESTPWLARRSKPDAGSGTETAELWEKKEEGPTLSAGASLRRDVLHGSRAGLPPNPARLPRRRSESLQRLGRGGDPSFDPTFMHGPGQDAWPSAYPAPFRVT